MHSQIRTRMFEIRDEESAQGNFMLGRTDNREMMFLGGRNGYEGTITTGSFIHPVKDSSTRTPMVGVRILCDPTDRVEAVFVECDEPNPITGLSEWREAEVFERELITEAFVERAFTSPYMR